MYTLDKTMVFLLAALPSEEEEGCDSAAPVVCRMVSERLGPARG